MVMVRKFLCVLVTLLHLLHITSSQSLVKNLPGFGDLPFTLNTGYIGVGERGEAQLFYYFVESQRSPKDDPFLLWLIGGQACSAISDFFYGNGPLIFNYDKFDGRSLPELQLNPYTWTKELNILYVDSPAGTGFSYSETAEGYNTSDTQTTEHLYEFLQKWLMNHPKFRSNPLYIGGGSYAGKFVAPLALKAYEDKDYKLWFTPSLNIQGYVLGSPVIDILMDRNSQVEFAHQHSLISDELYESIKSSCNGSYVVRDPNNKACTSDYEAYSELVHYINENQILDPKCLSRSYENRRFLSDGLKSILQTNFKCQEEKYAVGELWANYPEVRKALHVREGTKEDFQRCNYTIPYTMNVQSVVEYHQKLTNTNLRSLVYCGDLDMAIPYFSTHYHIKSLNLELKNIWHAWFVEGEVAGYAEKYKKSGYHMTYATVKGGGSCSSGAQT